MITNQHTWNKLEILQDILQFKIFGWKGRSIFMEGQKHFYGRAEVQWKGKSTYIEVKDTNFIKWHDYK